MASNEHDTLALRLAEILRLLYMGDKPDRKELAQRFGVSERTIYRDLNRLGNVIVPLPNGRCQLAEEYRGKLSPADLQTFARISGVQRLFPDNERGSWLGLLKPGRASYLVRDGHFEDGGPDKQLFDQLDQAIAKHRCCQLDYTGRQRQVQPYRLVHNKGIWYLAATENDRLKTFALGRITELRILDASFVADPDIQAQIEDDDDVWFSQDRLEVTVRVSKSNAYYFQRRNVLPHQELIEEQKDGGLLLRCRVNHPNQLLPIIRYWIPHVRIIEPDWLQHRLRDELTEYLQ